MGAAKTYSVGPCNNVSALLDRVSIISSQHSWPSPFDVSRWPQDWDTSSETAMLLLRACSRSRLTKARRQTILNNIQGPFLPLFSRWIYIKSRILYSAIRHVRKRLMDLTLARPGNVHTHFVRYHPIVFHKYDFKKTKANHKPFYTLFLSPASQIAGNFCAKRRGLLETRC